jgi:NAD+ diphosphatase
MQPRNPYSSAEIDRASHEREDEERMTRARLVRRGALVPIDTEKNLVKTAAIPMRVPAGHDGPRRRQRRRPPDLPGLLSRARRTFAVDVTGKDVAAEELGEFVDLRQVGALLFAREGSILAYARGMTYWHRRHRYCGVCGASTKVTRGGHVRNCTNEKLQDRAFPAHRSRGDHAGPSRRQVPARPRQHFPRGMHSTLAGFVEPGESFEDAVAREVYEEVRCR